VRYQESETVELKEIVNADFKKEIIAFANTNGGEIFVGVAKNGTVMGIGQAEEEMERIGNMIRDGIKPDLTAYTSIESIVEEGHTLIHISISRGMKRPYHLTDKGLKPGGVYVRHGISSVPATDEAIRQMLKESDGTVFDAMRSINQELTFEYAGKVFEEQGVDFRENNMRTLGLVDEDGYYTNAALLLSDQCGHIIRCAVYTGRTKGQFKSRKEFSGSIFKQVDDAYEFLELNNNLRTTFEGLRRVDYTDYPREALREALLNAVVHRDYDYSGSIIINIYEDRIEFISLGGLVKGLTLEDIKGGVSQPRNMRIAGVFYRLDFIESYGTGIQKILESYAGSGAEPEFRPAPASFVAILPNRNMEKAGYDPDMSREDNILRLLRQKKQASRKEIEAFLGCSSFPATTALNLLIEQGRVVKTGVARGTKYMLAE